MATKTVQHESTCGMVLISELNIDQHAQRKIAPAWVKAHSAKFDAEQLGYIVVNKRIGGKLFVIDGQHRVELLRQVGWGDQMIHAEVFNGLTQSDEAELFIARNDRKSVRRIDKFRVSITAGFPQAIDIDRIVREHGLVVSDQLIDGHIVAVDALERLYNGAGITSAREGPGALRKALGVIIQAWGKQSSSVNGKVLLGVGMVFLRYGQLVNEKEIIKKLAPFPGGAQGLLGKSRGMQEMRGQPLHHCVAWIVVDMYNKGRRSGKLDSWDTLQDRMREKKNDQKKTKPTTTTPFAAPLRPSA